MDLQTLAHERSVFGRGRALSDRRQVERSTIGEVRDRSDELHEDALGLDEEDVRRRQVVLGHERRLDVLNRDLPTTEQRQLDRPVLLAGDLRRRGTELFENDAEVRLLVASDRVDVLHQERVRRKDLVESDVDLEVLLRQRHVLIHLELLKEVADFAELIEEGVHSSLVRLDERIQRRHVLLFCVARLVRQVLQHLGQQRQRPLRMRGRRRQAVDEHVRLRRDDRRVDESQEEEAADQRADGRIRRVGVLALCVLIGLAMANALG